MGLLKNSRIYLAGPVEATQDATSWRQLLTHGLAPLGVQIWDPLVKPTWLGSSVDGEKQREMKQTVMASWLGARAHQVGPDISKPNHDIRLFCQHLAANCDIIIVMVDGSFTVGTWEELQIARFKPTFILATGRDAIPSMWLVDQLDAYHNTRFVFHTTVHSLVLTLNRIDAGMENLDPFTWIYLTYGDNQCSNIPQNSKSTS